MKSHNPYFNRWFSAIHEREKAVENGRKSHNPYFNRWFSAITEHEELNRMQVRHNPYFNRWFSAILPPHIFFLLI